jgi:hypothetical protein
MSQLTIESFTARPESSDRLQHWLFDNTQPYIRGRVLEVESGTSPFASILIAQGIPVHLSDSSKANRHTLRFRYKDSPLVRMVHNIDFNRPDFGEVNTRLTNAFSTIISANVTAHSFMGKDAVKHARLLLRDYGHLILVIPALTEFYPGMDADIETIRRQNRSPLRELLTGFDIRKKRFFRLEENGNDCLPGPAQLYALAIAKKCL